jgi:hypothetical protein
VLIVPLLGFDAEGYRLGYGGGHYDRTLAAMVPRPLTIGVGYALGRLETIYPQPHDIPLDAIVTETGYVRHRNGGGPLGELNLGDATSLIGRGSPRCADAKRQGGSRPGSPVRDLYEENEEAGASYASPPCFMHELDPSYLGYAGTAETIAMLNDLLGSALEGDGRDAAAQTAPPGGTEDGVALHAMLRRHVLRLGGRPARSLPETAQDRCDRAPGAIVRKLREILPKIGDGALHDDLKAALRALERQTRDSGESR